MMKLILLTTIALGAVSFVPQASAETCALGYNPDAVANVCVVTAASDPHCGSSLIGNLCPGVKVQVNPVQVAINYEDGLVCYYVGGVNNC